MFSKINEYYFNFLLIFFIPLWITGPAICDILLSIGAILGFINFKKINKIDNQRSKFIKIYLFTVIINFLITIYNNFEFNDDRSIEFILKSLFDLRFPFFCFFFLSINNISIRNSIKYVSISILLCLIFIFIETYTQLIFKISFFGFDSPYILDRQNFDIERISGPFVDELILGTFLSKLILPATLFLYFSEQKYLSYTSLPLFFITSLIIINTGEKNAILNLFLISTILPFLIYKNILVKYRILILSFILVILILISNLFFPKQFNRYFYNTLASFGFDDLSISLRNMNAKFNYEYSTLQDIDQSFERNFINSQHGALLEKSLFLIKNNFIIGLGRNGFLKHCNYLNAKDFNSIYSEYCSKHPHNYILETLNNYGLVGLLLFLYCFYIYSRCFISYKETKTIDIPKYILLGYFFTILILLFPFNLTTSFYSNYSSSIFWFILSISLLREKKLL